MPCSRAPPQAGRRACPIENAVKPDGTLNGGPIGAGAGFSSYQDRVRPSRLMDTVLMEWIIREPIDLARDRLRHRAPRRRRWLLLTHSLSGLHKSRHRPRRPPGLSGVAPHSDLHPAIISIPLPIVAMFKSRLHTGPTSSPGPLNRRRRGDLFARHISVWRAPSYPA